jgi:hypothetical protein
VFYLGSDSEQKLKEIETMFKTIPRTLTNQNNGCNKRLPKLITKYTIGGKSKGNSRKGRLILLGNFS